MICPHCGKEHSDEAVFCPETGNSLLTESVCPHCGQTHPPNAQFCPITGKNLISTNEIASAPSRKRPFHTFIKFVFALAILSLLVGLTWVFTRQNPLLNNVPFIEKIISVASSVTPSVELAVTITPSAEQNPGIGVTVNPNYSPTIPILPTNTISIKPSSTVIPSPTTGTPFGKIVYTCQIFKNNDRNQICIMNADGTDQRRLTTDDNANHFYPSLASDGMSIVFSSSQTGSHEIYEMDLTGKQTRLTSMGGLYAPEISPDGQSIVFTKTGGGRSSIWLMSRNGSNPREVYSGDGVDVVDPTWSPDGKKILFAMGIGDDKHLYTINIDGTDLRIVNEDFTTRGRSDWSWGGDLIAGYSGGSWQRKIYLMNSDGSNLIELYSSGNVQAPSFSPDDLWVAFTGYIDNMGNDNGCEIYIIRTNGEDLRRLTDNGYCDWQPRWGP